MIDPKIKVTIDVCDSEQQIELSKDFDNVDCIKMNCIELGGKSFLVYMNKAEALLLASELNKIYEQS